MKLLVLKSYFISAPKLIASIVVTILVILLLPILVVSSLDADVVKALRENKQSKIAGNPTTGRDIAPNNTYAFGNCTSWAYSMRYWNNNPIPNDWGNANTWDDNAKADGYAVSNTPAVGDVFQTDQGEFGHVAFVTEVKENGNWIISEMNFKGLNIVNNREFDGSLSIFYNFIKNKK